MDAETRIFPVAEWTRPADGEPVRSVVLQTGDSTVVVWHILPGQEIAAHVHPHGQDTWTVLSGSADYFQGNGVVARVKTGDIAVARPGQVHGARNTDPALPFIFVSVVAPGDPGFALAEK